MDKKQLLMIATAGGAATALGVFLPWVTFSDEGLGAALRAVGESPSVAGIRGGDGKIVLVLGLVGAAAAGALFLGKALPVSGRKAIVAASICLALAALICVIDFLGMSAPAAAGIGLWLCMVGSIAGTATLLLARMQMGSELAEQA